MFPAPMRCGAGLSAGICVILALYRKGMRLKSFLQGLSSSARAEPYHPQGDSWAHIFTKQVNYSLDPSEKIGLVSTAIMGA